MKMILVYGSSPETIFSKEKNKAMRRTIFQNSIIAGVGRPGDGHGNITA